jgi:hypothetical protein
MPYPSYRRGHARRTRSLTPPPALDPLVVLCRQIAARTAVAEVRLFLPDGELLDRPALVMRAHSVLGPPPDRVDGIAEVAAETARIIATPDDGEAPFAAALGVPLHNRRGLVGVLTLRRRAQDGFAADDVERARGLARHAIRTVEQLQVAPATTLRGQAIVRGVAPIEAAVTAFPHEAVARRLRGRGNRFAGALEEVGVELDDVRIRLRENVCLSMRAPLAALRATLRAHRLAGTRTLDTTALHRALRGAGDDDRDLALLAAARAAGVQFPQADAVLVTRRWSSVLALAAVAGNVAAVAGAAPLDPVGLAATILHAAHVPTLAGVEGIGDAAPAGATVRLDDGAVVQVRSGA